MLVDVEGPPIEGSLAASTFRVADVRRSRQKNLPERLAFNFFWRSFRCRAARL